MKKIAILTATRAEYGLLTPLIRRVMEDDQLELRLIVTGGHLSEKQGMTVEEIENDGFPIAHTIPILEDGDTPYDVSVTMANAIRGFAKCFRDDRPDMVVILGDRTEMLGVASAAMNERIPIAHINGGDVTEGAVDDCVRHALTKMSYLHFTSCETYRKRVIQLGESPDRVFNVGALGVENIKQTKMMARKELGESIGFDLSGDYAVVTYHPVTLGECTVNEDDAEMKNEEKTNPVSPAIDMLFEALEAFPDLKLLITKANADSGGQQINRMIDAYAAKHPERCVAVFSLGRVRYLSALKHATVVIGNSSSGIMETPSFGVPCVNIGDRQKGRIQAENIINCEPEMMLIRAAIEKALSGDFQRTAETTVNPYGDGNTSEKIITQIKRFLLQENPSLKKSFYDIPYDEK